ncbi:secondary thiamine-phosphate synthase enzyme YjbQ [Candidatus Pelagibacter communis]|uniref:secondary thiamine-phosphate synthase enzyme YjbQ n=1 Tax=Pelagibacter ubique TaxID=198252 RepID=UPI00094DC9F6|nr:secondary thiamine-phosphate synthase enzyme YjbQ [Candidatus Pelagibacter ubique]MDA9745725.1 secondary thiamine-phosphate synthase enzyme YjbQ [Candidatus Pelagibacter sp.]
MIQKFFNLVVNTSGQRLYEITDKTIEWIEKNNFTNGMLNMSIQHTSASLIVQENADPDVQTDLINYFDKLVPMDKKLYIHSSEGKDDMPAHIKSALTNNQISLSIKESKLILGTWQGIYLFEHRLDSHKRTIVHHYIGD